MSSYLTAAETAERLGISRATLYAYVSRGLLHAHPGPTPRESRYAQADVDMLAGQRKRGRKPREVAKATLSWGLPVLESAITLIEDGRLYLRGADIEDLAESDTVEAVAARLWQCAESAAFGSTAPMASPVLATVQSHLAGRRPEEALLPLFTIASDDAPTARWQAAPERLAEGCGALVRLLAACLLGTAPSAAPIHEQCASAWQLDADGADLVRMALVLCADHELNASGFTARCVASTGASLRAAVVGGLAALTGGRHGGATARVEALWDELGESLPTAGLQQRLARGEALPGFGHHLYPEGDVRARLLLARILLRRPAWAPGISEAQALVGQPPSLDFALVAVRRHLALPQGAAYGLFALGRSLGWIAHALEQRNGEALIRPRAAYTGPRPT
ncbi:MAG: citrate synthase family protein [Pseudomonadota bacterium]